MSADLVPVLFANACGGIFVLVLLALGTYLIVFSLRSKKKAEASQGWPSVAGTMTLSEVKQSINRNEDGIESISYYPAVEYTYQYAGQSFTSKRLQFGGVQGQKNSTNAQKVLARYPQGGSVTVYYNPENPSEAVLERQAGGSKVSLVIGIILLVLSVCIACPLLVSLVRNLLSGV